ncbi:PDZ domain-containing protein [Nocardioides sp.]|uniref:PDZ domain-containing protein n=1 Tax=Nocardioides sp. TaxID=35761 RepID=UPI002C8ED44D|nr:PDZ domain-containing protein [Nocardioides sp.]HVX54125.1 PDZ domain-containing protein [Nocardioides sp.]
MDDVLEAIVEILYETVGPRRATAVLAAVAGAAAAGLTLWYVHLGHLLADCATLGIVGRLVDPSAPNCGLDKNLHPFVLVATIVGWLVCAGFAVAFVVLMANPSLFPEEARRGVNVARPSVARGGMPRVTTGIATGLRNVPAFTRLGIKVHGEDDRAVVDEVPTASLGERIGLRVGDAIVAVNQRPVRDAHSLDSVIDEINPQARVDESCLDLSIIRQGNACQLPGKPAQ